MGRQVEEAIRNTRLWQYWMVKGALDALDPMVEDSMTIWQAVEMLAAPAQSQPRTKV